MWWLWFDVGNGRYTTNLLVYICRYKLWFDVGNGRYTTVSVTSAANCSCGLM